MEINIFLEKLKEALEEEQPIHTETQFSDLDNFDSMSIMILIAFVDEHFGEKITAFQFKEIKSVKDLINTIGDRHFDK